MTNPPSPQNPGQQAGYPPAPPGSPQAPASGYGPPPPPGAPYNGGYPPPAPPRKKGTSKALIGILCCVGLLVAFVVIAAIAAPKNDTGTPPTTAAGDSGGGSPGEAPGPSGGPGTSQDNPAPVGTEVTAAKGWTIKVNSANLDANADMAKGNQFNKPRLAGNRFIAVNVTVRNGSDKPGMPLVEMSVGALPASGAKVDPAFAIAGIDTLDLTTQLQPGASKTGLLVFELPPADISSTVLLAEPQFTLDKNEDQRFLAIQ